MPPDLPTAVEVIEAVGRPDFRLLVDTMHIVRGGAGPAELAALDPDTIGYVQLSDVPLLPAGPTYHEEAMFDRMVPGTGELPLLEILDAVPRDLVIGSRYRTAPKRRPASARMNGSGGASPPLGTCSPNSMTQTAAPCEQSQ